ncbi:MAG: hypothetical protein GXO97_00110 [Nitrospirae bacterium]|nr:hypothetical protein [Nitrospirota bacterium]
MYKLMYFQWNRTGWLWVLALLVLVQYSSCSAVQAKENRSVVAVVGNRTITESEFRATLKRIRRGEDVQKSLETFTPEGRERILNEVIDRVLFSLAAKKRGMDRWHSVKLAIQEAVERVLAERYIQEELKKLDLSDEALRRYYESHIDLFTSQKRVKARHINTATKEEAEKALKRIKKGEDFSKVASEVNIDGTKARGGDLGWVVRGIMVKPFEEVLFSLKEGEVSDIVKTRFGYHIIKVEEIKEGKPIPFERIKKRVRERLIEEHIQKLREELKKEFPVTINSELLKRIRR